MNTLTAYLWHHKASLLFILCSITHFAAGFLFLHYTLPIPATYNFATAIIYLFFLYISSNLQDSFLFIFLVFEIIIYSIFIVFCTGHDSGTIYLIVSLPSIMFITERSSRKSPAFLVSMCILIIADAVFLLAADFYLDLDSNSARQLPVEFYTVNGSVCLALSVLLVIYIAFLSNRLITHDRAAEIARLNRLSFIANHDALTGILNRRTINMQLKTCDAHNVDQDKDYAFTIFDIDDFKKFNDTYGHDCGDDILAEMTKAVTALLPKSTSFARWGGEEFAILFTGNSAEAPQVLELVRSKIADMRFSSRGRSDLVITLTFGLSMSGTGTPVRMMLIEADNNLMFGKRNGKNCVVTGNNVIFKSETAV